METGIKDKIFSDKRIMCVGLLVLFFVLEYIWYVFAAGGWNDKLNTEIVQTLNSEVEISWRESSVRATLPTKVDVAIGETVEITKILTSEEIQGNCMMFYSTQEDVKVLLDDEVLLDYFGIAQSLPFEEAPGSRWCLFRLPQDFDGKQLKIVMKGYFDSFFKEIPEIYVGSKSALIFYMIRQSAFTLLTVIPMFIIGIALFVLAFVVRKGIMSDRTCMLSLLIISTSVWILMESRVTQLFMNTRPYGFLILSNSFFSIPVFVAGFLLTYPTIKRHVYMKALFWVNIVCYFVESTAQWTKAINYIDLVSLVHLQIVIEIVGLTVSFIYMRKHRQDDDDYTVYVACLLLAFFGVADLVCYYLFPAHRVGQKTTVGMLAFSMYLGGCALKQINQMSVEEAQHNLYKELAFQDIMTNLCNRTAFERDMDEIRHRSSKDGLIIMIADLNNLKLINDQYGHASGDEAIIKTGHLLKMAFKDYCECYRIGGDEFCVISDSMAVEDFEKASLEFQMHVSKVSEGMKYPYSVACGYKIVDRETIDETYREADRLMYEAKKRMKMKMAGRTV